MGRITPSPSVPHMIRFLAPAAAETEQATGRRDDRSPVAMHRLIHPFRLPTVGGKESL